MALTDKLTTIADAVRAKAGITDKLTLEGMATAIKSIETGGGGQASSNEKEIVFIDYDGTVLYSYTLDELQSLTELPSLPSHDGLISQGWNWTLDDLKTLNRAVTVGALYVTDDGATRLYIELVDSANLTAYVRFGTGNWGATIDWGDGTTEEAEESTTTVYNHNYDTTGKYVISISCTEGAITLSGSGSYNVMGSTSSADRRNGSILKKVELGSNVKTIAEYAFDNCYSLKTITIPNDLEDIRTYAFDKCYNLVSITLPPNLNIINMSVFMGCHSLSAIAIPDGVTTINSSAFGSCCNLTSITIPETVTTIAAYAFQACYSLTSFEIPTGVTVINNYCFQNCYNLSSITIPETVTTIGAYAFDKCYSLTSIKLPDGVTSIGNYCFRNCYSLSSITMPDSTKSIGTYCFQACYSLISIKIPDGVTVIGNYAFQACYSLISIKIPDGVKTISNYCFQSCFSLSSITIPEAVTAINASSFGNIQSIVEYHIKPTTPPTLGTNVFSGISSTCKIYVPADSLEAYQAATNWSTYASKMVGE